MNQNVIGLSLLVSLETVHSFSLYLPSLYDLNKQPAEAVRAGYGKAAMFSMAVAGVVAFLAKSPAPIIASGLTAGAMTLLYEQSIPEQPALPATQALDTRTGL